MVFPHVLQRTVVRPFLVAIKPPFRALVNAASPTLATGYDEFREYRDTEASPQPTQDAGRWSSVQKPGGP